MDHASGYLHIEHQLGFLESETIRDKQNFYQITMDNGVVVDLYLDNNVIFCAKYFLRYIY